MKYYSRKNYIKTMNNEYHRRISFDGPFEDMGGILWRYDIPSIENAEL